MGSDAGVNTRAYLLLLVDGAGLRHLRVIMKHYGHACLMQASPAMNVSPANVRRIVLSSVSAKKLPYCTFLLL